MVGNRLVFAFGIVGLCISAFDHDEKNIKHSHSGQHTQRLEKSRMVLSQSSLPPPPGFIYHHQYHRSTHANEISSDEANTCSISEGNCAHQNQREFRRQTDSRWRRHSLPSATNHLRVTSDGTTFFSEDPEAVSRSVLNRGHRDVQITFWRRRTLTFE